MQPVLVDGGELAAKALVEIIDDFWVALHAALRSLKAKVGLNLNLECF
jgi:hypothetical protein